MSSQLPLKLRPFPARISFVIPLYNEEEVIEELKNRMTALLDRLDAETEIVIVDDGSKDRTAEKLWSWAIEDKRIRVLSLSRNFGHQAAITAGLDISIGDVAILMDGDLQDPPELSIEMLEQYQAGYDVVYAQRVQRHGETVFKRITANLFYLFMSEYVSPDLPRDTGDFRLMSRPVIDAFVGLRERQRFIRGLVAWLGFKQTSVKFERAQRVAGISKFPLRRMIRFAFDGIFSFSSAPLRLGIYIGSILFVSSIGISIYAIVLRLVYKTAFPGWSSLIVLTALIGSNILLCLGIIGEYVGRIYEEIKGRPIYVVGRTANITLGAKHEVSTSEKRNEHFGNRGLKIRSEVVQ